MRTTTISDFKDICDEARTQSSKTWDAPFLYRKKNHLVLLYGQQRLGFPEHEEIKFNVQYVGQAVTHSQNFVMYNKRQGDASYPVALRELFSAERGAIRGDLFLVKTPVMFDLDDIYANGVHYTRVKVPVVQPFQFERTDKIISEWKFHTDRQAWMYIGTQAMRELVKEEGQFQTATKAVGSAIKTPVFTFTMKDIE